MTRGRVLAGVACLVVIAGVSGTVLARRAEANPVLRTVTVGTDLTGVALDGGTGRAFVVDRGVDPNAYTTGIVHVLDTRSGAVLRIVAVGQDPRAVAVDGPDGHAFVVNDDDASANMLDLHSGAVLHTVSVGPNPHAVAVDPQTHRAFTVNVGNGTVSVLDARSGAVLRTVHLHASFDFGSAVGAVADTRTGRVFIGGAGIVYVLDARSGAVLRTVTVGGDNTAMAVDTPLGRVFVAGDMSLNVLDARNGQLLRTIALNGMIGPLAVDERRGRVFVTTGSADSARAALSYRAISTSSTSTTSGRFRYGVVNYPASFGADTLAVAGSLSVLDARSGRLLRTIPAGVSPRALAVDEPSGHVVVVDAGGTVPAADPWSWVPGGLRRLLPFLAQHDHTRTIPPSVSVLDVTT